LLQKPVIFTIKKLKYNLVALFLVAKKKRVKKTGHKATIEKRGNKKAIYIAVVVVVIILLLILFIIQTVSDSRIKEGSVVTVDYTLYLENGDIYDTTIESVGKGADLVDKDYSPLVFTVGDKDILSGFQDELLGLRSGDEKRFTLTPERAYGERLDERVIEFPRNINLTRYTYLDVNKFRSVFGKEPIIGEIVKTPTISWDFKITDADENKVTLENVLSEGDAVRLVVLSVDEEYIYLRRNLNVGDYVSLGPNQGFAVITEVNEDSFTADANPPLAGKTIIFDVKITDVQNSGQ